MSLNKALELVDDIVSIVNQEEEEEEEKQSSTANDNADIDEPLVMGIDCSTQSLTISIYTVSTFARRYWVCIGFDEQLPHYKTDHGVYKKDGNVVTAPSMMFVEALDLALTQLQTQHHCPFSKIVAISGSGQQHGSVYWDKDSESGTLLQLNSELSLLDNYSKPKSVFIVDDGPIWMDSSTGVQCQQLSDKMDGGALKVASISGSVPIERFTGNQIAKLFQTSPEIYKQCERISLVSSFMASVFLGKYAPIDVSDGSGMNLLDINTRDWSPELLNACAPNLCSKLGGAPVESDTYLGAISPYFVERYHFAAECQIIAFSGDNPCSLAGLMCCESGDICISLGTSDCLFAVTNETPNPCEIGCILCSPIHHNCGHMLMLVYKNGSLAREQIRDQVCADQSWLDFSAKLSADATRTTSTTTTTTSKRRRLGFYFFEPEISPAYDRQIRRFDVADDFEMVALATTEAFDARDVRGIIESQFMAMRSDMELLGVSKFNRILATGGASQNQAILQVIADVFGSDVYVAKFGSADTATKGAALRALHAYKQKTMTDANDNDNDNNNSNQNRLLFSDVCQQLGIAYEKVAEANADKHPIYETLIRKRKEVEPSLNRL